MVQNDWCPYKKKREEENDMWRQKYTGRGQPCDKRGRDWRDARISSNRQKLGEKHGTHSPSKPPEGTTLSAP